MRDGVRGCDGRKNRDLFAPTAAKKMELLIYMHKEISQHQKKNRVWFSEYHIWCSFFMLLFSFAIDPTRLVPTRRMEEPHQHLVHQPSLAVAIHCRSIMQKGTDDVTMTASKTVPPRIWVCGSRIDIPPDTRRCKYLPSSLSTPLGNHQPLYDCRRRDGSSWLLSTSSSSSFLVCFPLSLILPQCHRPSRFFWFSICWNRWLLLVIVRIATPIMFHKGRGEDSYQQKKATINASQNIGSPTHVRKYPFVTAFLATCHNRPNGGDGFRGPNLQ